jgi:NAD(P)-dependent dehydrogenase (short-subunit alcohol dehydrogenase family)
MKLRENSIFGQFGLQGKIAIITGTTLGVGQPLAEALIEAGTTIFIDRLSNVHLSAFSASKGMLFERIQIDLIKASKKDSINDENKKDPVDFFWVI